MSIQYEYLDLLYKWKVEADQELEKIENTNSTPLPTENADHVLVIRKLKIENAKSVVNKYTASIRSYLTHHNNGQNG